MNDLETLLEVAHLNYLANQAQDGRCFWCGDQATRYGPLNSVLESLEPSEYVSSVLKEKGKSEVIQVCSDHVRWTITDEAKHRAKKTK